MADKKKSTAVRLSLTPLQNAVMAKRWFDLVASRLAPHAGNPPNRAIVLAAICKATNIQPSEFNAMKRADQIALMKSVSAGDAPVAAASSSPAAPNGPQHGGTKKAEKKRQTVSTEDAEKLARKLGRSKSFRVASQREWAKRLKIATGRVGKLPYWKELHPKSEANTRPKAVSLTTRLESSLGENDPELTRLMNEQAEDDEGSPLDSTPRRKRSRRPSV